MGRTGSTSRPRTSALAAAAVVLVVNLAAGLLSGRHPFGSYTRNINDMWNQFIPFHLHLRDLMTGASDSDWWFNWSLGAGTSFVGDVGTYLASPFSLLVLVFPRDQIELAMWVVVAVKMAVAAAAMVFLLDAVRPGPRWALILLGAAYGLCGWAMDDASYVPMWLDGLIGLPLLALVGWWTLHRRRFVPGSVVVAVVWWSNYYTAYMASLGAATVLLALVLIHRQSPREGVGTMLRFLAQGVLGVGLAAVLLVPTLVAVLASTPGTMASLRPVPASFFAERLLSGTEGVGRSPSLSVGLLALVAALALPWLTALARRTRIVLVVGLSLVLLSMNWHPTHLVWHLFSSPNGSQFRQAFVASFWVVLLAWFAVGVRWSRTAVVASGVGVAIVGLVAALGPGEFSTPWTWWTLGGALVALTVLAVVPERARDDAGWAPLRTAGAVGLCVAFAVEATGTYLVTQRGQDEFLLLPPSLHSHEYLERYAPTGPSPWPEGRRIAVDVPNHNSGAFLGVQGLDYYSSLTPLSMSDAARALGFRLLAGGRSIAPGSDSVVWAMMSVSRVVTAADDVEVPAPPMVRVRDDAPPLGDDVWDNRAALLGADVYRVPATEISRDGSTFETHEGPGTFTDGEVVLRATCEPGEIPQVLLAADAPVSVADADGTLLQVVSEEGVVQGQVSGATEFVLTFGGSISLTADPVACADLGVVAAAADVAAPSQLSMAGSTIVAGFEEPVTGMVTVATFVQDGWACSLDGRPAEIVHPTGLLTVRAEDASELRCEFSPPGGPAGVAVSLASLAVLALLGVLGVRRRGVGVEQPVGEGERGDDEGERDGEDAAHQRGVGLGEAEELHQEDRADGREGQVGEHPEGEGEEPAPRGADAVGEPAVDEEREHH